MTKEAIFFGLSFFVMGTGVCIVAGTVLHAIFHREDK